MACVRVVASSVGLAAALSTDSNIPISRGLPAVTIGRGGAGGGAHLAEAGVALTL